MPRAATEKLSLTIPARLVKTLQVIGILLFAAVLLANTYMSYDYYRFRRLPVWELIDADIFFRKDDIMQKVRDLQAKQQAQEAAANASTTTTTVPASKKNKKP